MKLGDGWAGACFGHGGAMPLRDEAGKDRRNRLSYHGQVVSESTGRASRTRCISDSIRSSGTGVSKIKGTCSGMSSATCRKASTQP